jgi:hypothetical protein
MSNTGLIILTVVEIAALVVVLAVFLHLLAGRLRSVAEKLFALNAAVSGAQKNLGILKVGAPVINVRLANVVAALTRVATRAERLAGRSERVRGR